MPYRWAVGDLRTGRIYRDLDVKGTWSTVFDAPDSLRLDFPIYSSRARSEGGGYGEGAFGQGAYGVGELETIERVSWPDAMAESAPVKSFLAVAWVDEHETEHWLAGGPIWVQDLDRASGALTLGSAGLESYYVHRFVLPVLTADQSPSEVLSRFEGKERALILKRIVQQANSWPDADLQVVLPSDDDLGGLGTDHFQEYPGYELGRVTQRMRQVADLEDGPEFQFIPEKTPFTTGTPRNLRWQFRVGREADRGLLTQAGPAHEIDMSVPKSMVVNVKRKVDGSNLATDTYAAGQGQGEGRPIARASSSALTSVGYPRLEAEKSATDNVSEQTTLQAHADGLLARRGWSTEQYTITVDAASWWSKAAGARPGDWLTLKADGEVIVPDGPNELRILSMSAGDNETVDLSCVPKREVA